MPITIITPSAHPIFAYIHTPTSVYNYIRVFMSMYPTPHTKDSKEFMVICMFCYDLKVIRLFHQTVSIKLIIPSLLYASFFFLYSIFFFLFLFSCFLFFLSFFFPFLHTFCFSSFFAFFCAFSEKKICI